MSKLLEVSNLSMRFWRLAGRQRRGVTTGEKRNCFDYYRAEWCR